MTEPDSKRRRLWRVAAVLAVVAVVLGVFAWQQGDDDGAGGGPLNAIAAAAEKTQNEPGGRATMRAVFTSPDPSKSLRMTGRSTFDDETERAWMVMEFTDPESDEPAEMEAVMDGSVMYVSSSIFGELPGDASWMSVDLSVATGLEMLGPAESDPRSELEMLEDATGVRELGKAKVRGVQTTRYAGVVSVSEQAANMREQGAEDLAAQTEENGRPLRLEVWIDAKELTRRMRFVTTEPAEDGEGPTTVDMQVDFIDFGLVPEIEVPDEDDVFDATSIAEEELDARGDG